MARQLVNARGVEKGKTMLHVLCLSGMPIFEQLQLEEALFRTDDRNWFIWNEAMPTPSIVLGISGKPVKMLHLDQVHRDKVPMIKRFSGGGTVIVDNGTVFTSMMCNHVDIPELKPLPREIMTWTGELYQSPINELIEQGRDDKGGARFKVREDDYVVGEYKVAGNAQSISRHRWLHHTSFLWEFEPSRMSYLRLPEKQPTYRAKRDHLSFLQPLSKYLPSKPELYQALLSELETRFSLREVDLKDVQSIVEVPHRQTTKYLIE